jgi:hypothetical protein
MRTERKHDSTEIGMSRILDRRNESPKAGTMSRAVRRIAMAVVAAALALWAGEAGAVIGTLIAPTNVYNGTGAPPSTNVTIGAGTNRMLVVTLGWGDPSSLTTTVSVTYGGTLLTKAATTEGTAGNSHAWVFYMKDSPTLMNGIARPLVVSFSSQASTRKVVDYAVFTNVDQNSPADVASCTSGSSTATTTCALPTSPSFDIALASTAVEIVSVMRTGSTTPRTVTSWDPGWVASPAVAGVPFIAQ